MDYRISEVCIKTFDQIIAIKRLLPLFGLLWSCKKDRRTLQKGSEDERKMAVTIPLKVMAFPDWAEGIPFKNEKKSF